MQKTLSDYYAILEINENASLDEIKKAFRKKAKKFHPDRNTATSSQEKFIAVTEAYEYITNHLKNPTSFSDIFNEYKADKEREEQLRKTARKKAQEFARKKYEEFINSDFYKNDQASLIILDHLQFFFITLIILVPVICFCSFVLEQKILGYLVSLPIVYFWYNYYKKHIELDTEELLFALKRVFNIWELQLVSSLLINFFLYTNYTLNTEISLLNIYLIYFSINFVFVFLVLGKKINKTATKTLFGILIPLGFNILFLLNFILSFQTEIESYRFIKGNSSIIKLENNKYYEQEWFRFFIDYNDLREKDVIHYSFREGVFGFRVLTNYELE